MIGLGFIRRPTRGELKVIFFFLSVVSFALGAVAIIVGLRAPADKAMLAHQAIFYGSACLFFGVLFVISLWLLCRFEDRP
jgi:hypothetical protein